MSDQQSSKNKAKELLNTAFALAAVYAIAFVLNAALIIFGGTTLSILATGQEESFLHIFIFWGITAGVILGMIAWSEEVEKGGDNVVTVVIMSVFGAAGGFIFYMVTGMVFIVASFIYSEVAEASPICGFAAVVVFALMLIGGLTGGGGGEVVAIIFTKK